MVCSNFCEFFVGVFEGFLWRFLQTLQHLGAGHSSWRNGGAPPSRTGLLVVTRLARLTLRGLSEKKGHLWREALLLRALTRIETF